MTANPERNLWQEVLLHTINDARLKVPRRKLSENALSEALDARRYLTTPSADLAMVCMFAGVDMDALVDRMRKCLFRLSPSQAPDGLHTCGDCLN